MSQIFIYSKKGRVYNTGKENLQGKNKGGGIIYVGSFFRRETFQQCHEQSQDQKQIPGIFLARGADHRGSYGRGISSGLRPGGIYARGTDAPMILILIAATLMVSIVTPIVQYFLWRDGRKK